MWLVYTDIVGAFVDDTVDGIAEPICFFLFLLATSSVPLLHAIAAATFLYLLDYFFAIVKILRYSSYPAMTKDYPEYSRMLE